MSDNRMTNYEELFGTPERAASTLALCCFGETSDACETCVFDDCDGRLRYSGSFETVSNTMLEWLRGDAE